MTQLVLAGCRPEPLASYLKALGILRIVAGQADPDARGWWIGDLFALDSVLDVDGLDRLLIDRWAPTPVVSPWNNGSGFGTGRKGPEAVERIASSDLARLDAYRRCITVARRLYETSVSRGLSKRDTVLRARAELPDDGLAWLDATVVLTSDAVAFPPLLGTGGNDGRLDFSVAYMARLAEILGLLPGRAAPGSDEITAWLHAALYGDEQPKLRKEAVGQFDPGAAGGANSAPTGQADSLVNPWDWVLLVEGSLFFAAAAARRLGATGSSRAAVPFTVSSAAAGYSTSSEDEDSRGELWTPLWSSPATGPEVARVLSEGRADSGRQQARSGVDLARATATLGVDRGISSFVRHALLTRNGLATLAVPVGRVEVRDRVIPQVLMGRQLDGWVSAITRVPDPPAQVRSTLRRMTTAQFELATSPDTDSTRRDALTAVLVAAAALESAVGRATQFRARSRTPLLPVDRLVANQWLPALDDESTEFRLAAGWASLHDRHRPDSRDTGSAMTLRRLIKPVAWSDRRRGLVFADGPPSVVPGRPGLAPLLAAVHVRREVDVGFRPPLDPSFAPALVGVTPWFDYGLRMSVPDVMRWVDGELDEARLVRVLDALLLLRWTDAPGLRRPLAGDGGAWSLELAALVPAYAGAPIHRDTRSDDRPSRTVQASPAKGWTRQLSSGRRGSVAAEALKRLRLVGVDVPRALDRVAYAEPDDPARGERLCAALLLRISRAALVSLLAALDPPLPTPTAGPTPELEDITP